MMPLKGMASSRLRLHSWWRGINTLESHKLTMQIFLSARFVKSGDWDIVNITSKISETDHGDCCPFTFSEVVYTLEMKRKSLYYMFYLAIPSVILTVVALSSFLIHVESGERIGFVTTILLAMTVFLLVIPSFLPVTSDGLPILGINLQVTMIIIALVLFANIFVLRVHFKEETPPDWVEKLCDFSSNKKSKEAKQIHESQHNGAEGTVKCLTTPTSIEMIESSAESPALCERKEVEFTWQRVARKMDQVFFVTFVIVSSIAYAVTFTVT